jgi:hypothetical protein
MITVAEIKKKVIEFPDNKPVEDLIDEIIVLYKIQKGVDDVKNGDVLSLNDLDKEIEQWLQYK